MKLNSLPPAEKTQLNIGFMRLSDSAPLIIAQEQKFFQRYGLDVALSREMSWANVRDKVAVGTLDASQMLAPMPLVSSPRLKNTSGPFITGLMLNLNGNAITLSSGLSKQIDVAANKTGDHCPDPVLAARQLGEIVTTLPRQLTLATVYPYSMHTFQLRHWLALGGICPDRDVKIIVLPPEQMVDNLARGIIDGFCVGEPWNTAAVQAGIGSSVVSGYQLWNNAPEKALVVTEHWHNKHPSTHLRLRLAIMEAAAWLAHQENRQASVSILARKQYLDLPEHMIKPALLGHFQYNKHSGAIKNQDFIVFHRYQAGFPWLSRAEYLLRKNIGLQGSTIEDSEACQLIEKVYRADLYREAASFLGYSYPSIDYKNEGSHATSYLTEDSIELGPDLFLNGEIFYPCQG